MTNTPTHHGASHASDGNDPLVFADLTLGATGVITLTERTEPANAAANKAIIYAADNGSGKTRIMARFASGASVVIATEP